jgi:hypothetical protein
MNRGYQSKQQKKKETWSRSPLRAQIKAPGCSVSFLCRVNQQKKIVRDLAMNSQKIYGF